MDSVKTIPHLRKNSVTPWADVNVAAEAIGTKYVLASKPNPAAVAVDRMDPEIPIPTLKRRTSLRAMSSQEA